MEYAKQRSAAHWGVVKKNGLWYNIGSAKGFPALSRYGVRIKFHTAPVDGASKERGIGYAKQANALFAAQMA